MDVWFCVLRRNPIQKRFEKKLSDLATDAPSERVQEFVAFPLTLLIMDVVVFSKSAKGSSRFRSFLFTKYLREKERDCTRGYLFRSSFL
jgi:hypothetical protein